MPGLLLFFKELTALKISSSAIFHSDPANLSILSTYLTCNLDLNEGQLNDQILFIACLELFHMFYTYLNLLQTCEPMHRKLQAPLLLATLRFLQSNIFFHWQNFPFLWFICSGWELNFCWLAQQILPYVDQHLVQLSKRQCLNLINFEDNSILLIYFSSVKD